MVPQSGIVAVQMKDTTSAGYIRWESAIETQPITSAPDLLQDGDVLLAARGNRNYAVLVTNPPKALAAPHWYVIRCRDNKLLPAFLAWQLNCKPAQDYFRRESAGTTTPNLRMDSLLNMEIAVPPLEEQHRVIAIAEASRKERELCEQLIAATEQFNDGLARQLLNGHSTKKVTS